MRNALNNKEMERVKGIEPSFRRTPLQPYANPCIYWLKLAFSGFVSYIKLHR